MDPSHFLRVSHIAFNGTSKIDSDIPYISHLEHNSSWSWSTMKGARSEEQDLLVGSSITPSTVRRNGGGFFAAPTLRLRLAVGGCGPVDGAVAAFKRGDDQRIGLSVLPPWLPSANLPLAS
jgi:hypothetical protein